MVQYTLRSKLLKWIFWVNFGLTVIATLYFGWHYVADDIAGVAIAFVSFYLAGYDNNGKFNVKFTLMKKFFMYSFYLSLCFFLLLYFSMLWFALVWAILASIFNPSVYLPYSAAALTLVATVTSKYQQI